MKPQKQLIFWGLACAAFIVFVMIFKAVLLPFVLGIIIAYFLNPVVNWLGEHMRAPRKHAALFILCFFILIGVLIIVVSAPIIYRELSDLVSNFPDYLQKLRDFVANSSRKMQHMFGLTKTTNLETLLNQNAETAAGIANQLLLSLAHGGQLMLGFISVLVVTPIVAYFMMKEWNKIIYKIRSLLPREHKGTIIELIREIDRKLSGFIRGQLSVAFILGVFYAITLGVLGLRYGFLIGILTGIFSVIPLVGSTVGFLTSVTIAWFQSEDPYYVGIIAAIFIIGQLVEGNILTPRIVGKSVDLHPVWIFFALMAGASLAGILGMLLAVPVAAVVSVLCSFAVKKYKQSQYYLEEEIIVEPVISFLPPAVDE